jgi:hypothetical protein
MAIGTLAGEVLNLAPVSHTTSEVDNDAQSERVAANAGEEFTEQVGGSTEVPSGRGANHFDVMALPIHLASADRTRGCFGEHVEIGDREPEGRIGGHGEPQRSPCVRRVHGLLRLAIKGGGLDVGRDHPTVVLDRRAGEGLLAPAVVGLSWILVHDHQVGPVG